MTDSESPGATLPLTSDRLTELLDTGFEFSDRPAPVPADIRADWRVPLLMFVVDSCRGKRASLQQVQVIAWAAIFEESREDFLKAFRGDSNPATLLIRYDPAVTRAANLAVGLDLLSWHSGNRLALTVEGKAMLAKIREYDSLLADEREFLSDLGGSVTMTVINKMLGS